ncbi:AAA family ATPase [Pseudoalteromonas rubra]|uniref:AAA+ ATPase domain-containing protein n=1 Tax=Pseudoalteromonas rubra TaxID=43658 RepID=A0A5S3WT22_9GAMM|nr:MoxR family ATPase [Pseudoalteromonas rubra]TMP32043.1 hypothetical protein CWB98_21900 [Pseudoalteromonas rubra]
MNQSLQDSIRNDIVALTPTEVSGYVLRSEHIAALQAAWFARRPLLVRGEPGLGKTRLADAIANLLGFGLVKSVVQYNSSIEDLLYSIDYMERLHLANSPGISKEELKIERHIRPGKIWQAMAPGTLSKFNMERPHDKRGTVLLIDEIDKADPSLPNALLEVLDEKKITLSYMMEQVKKEEDHALLTIITSNDERMLPKAFLRRCAVLELRLGLGKEGVEQLFEIYKAHKVHEPEDFDRLTEENVCHVADKIIEMRNNNVHVDYHSGTSEFLDILRVLNNFDDHSRNYWLENWFDLFAAKSKGV